ncbi:MAG TPA: hypothetical protein VGL21_14870 [Jatrophihabitantaceae bacterium]
MPGVIFLRGAGLRGAGLRGAGPARCRACAAVPGLRGVGPDRVRPWPRPRERAPDVDGAPGEIPEGAGWS